MLNEKPVSKSITDPDFYNYTLFCECPSFTIQHHRIATMINKTNNKSSNYIEEVKKTFIDKGFDEKSREYKTVFIRKTIPKYLNKDFFRKFVCWILDDNIKGHWNFYKDNTLEKAKIVESVLMELEEFYPNKLCQLEYFSEWDDVVRMDRFLDNRNGFVKFGGSPEMFSNREKPIMFVNDKDLIDILNKNSAVDKEGRIVYMEDGETLSTFPVKFYVEFMLDSMHQNGQNKVYGDKNDIYPFIDNFGYIGWISKNPRNSEEDLKEAKRRLKKSFS